ncbi:sensor histidine kinase [Quisquiliibacterium transsilvanicum]|uniref:histidine kinase n=1 Tax=Quisquiliibacterium transsilvanicum TaxID=1549638 RepID=A0A7W8HHG7_9BURK|nr:sensor histidine kinase [Quisquiliibacterium transsilvanicum]MBB5272124.1 two-component system sensor histidine kinase TctE [Quisquiliibacterium transsilvanicum]
MTERRRRRSFDFAYDPREQRSLFGEILDWMLAPLLLLWPLSIVLTFVVARSLADAPFDRALIDHTEVIAQQVDTSGEQAATPPGTRLRDLLPAGSEEHTFFQVLSADGELLAGDANLPTPSLYDFPTPGRVQRRFDQHRGIEVRVAYTYVSPGEHPMSSSYPVLIQVAETLDARNALANEIIKGVIFPQFLILPVAVGLVWFALSRGLAPLERMQRRIRERSPDDLSPINPHDAPEELGPLMASFNDLLQRLGTNIAAQKRFIADAAHQMKTPLAGLRTQAELALRETDPQALRRSLEQVVESSERAAHMINQLLALARTENLRNAIQLEEMDLAPLAHAVASEWAPEAIRRGIDFGFESDDAPAPAAAHPILLRELLNNLIDNAIVYTPAGGQVTVRLGREGRETLLQVEDSGTGIPPEERLLVFERFYRILGTETSGSGLGLPIVAEIADQHGARVSIADGGPADAPRGTKVTVRFPPL